MSVEEFTKELLSEGYKPFRHVYKKGKGFEYVPTSINTTYMRANFNVIQNGCIDIRMVKDEDFKNQITIGLYEKDKPPTVISPKSLRYKIR